MKSLWFSVSKNKVIEFNFTRWHGKKFYFSFWHRNSSQDHKGFDITLVLFSFEFEIDFYDVRHREHYNE